MQHSQMYMLEAHGTDVERTRVAYDEMTTIRRLEKMLDAITRCE